MIPRSLALLVMLLLTAGCDRTLNQARRTVYVPWEEGLTLIYEDTTLPSAQRIQERLQRRVSASKETPEGRRVTITYSTLRSNQSFDFLHKSGSWQMMDGNTILFQMLPEGFPDRVNQWEDRARGLSFRVIGRATLQNPGLQLPDDFDRVGIWVEMQARNGSKRRIFFLPGIGEEESLVFKDGQWVMVNQLVSRGFTDAPVMKTDEKAP